MEEVKAMQKKCMSGIAHQRYRMKQTSENLKTYVYIHIMSTLVPGEGLEFRGVGKGGSLGRGGGRGKFYIFPI